MNRPLSIFVIALYALAGVAHSQSNYTLTTSPASTATLGQSVTLTATVAPAAAGTVTFYNGVTVLGSTTLNNGTASISTIMLPVSRSVGWNLTARFFDATPSLLGSANSTLKVTAVPGVDFRPPKAGSSSTQITQVGKLIEADFNNDGIMDVAVYGQSNLDILLGQSALGKATGKFAEPTVFTLITNVNCTAVVAADFNADGNTDLACFDGKQRTTIYLGDGTGNFTLKKQNNSTTNYLSIPNNPQGNLTLVVADFNLDGIPDLALVADNIKNPATNNQTGAVFFLPGNGDGTFSGGDGVLADSNVSYIASGVNNLGRQPYAMVVGDFNNDGIPDVLVAAQSQVNTSPSTKSDLFLMLGGINAGVFSFTTPSGGLNAPGLGDPTLDMGMVVGDFNGDGFPDVAYRSSLSNAVYVALGSAGGLSGAYPITTFTSLGKGWLATGDFNGDGNLDLAGSFDSTGSVMMILGNGGGTFGTLAPPQTVIAPCQGTYPITGNYNGDSRNDIMAFCASGAVSVALEHSATTTALAVSPQTQAQVGQQVTLTATVTPTGPTGTVTFYNGTNVLGTAPLTAGTASLTTILLRPSAASPLSARYDGDNSFDQSVSSVVNEKITTVAGKDFSLVSYVPPATVPNVNKLGRPLRLLQADFNNDGVMDFAVYGNQIGIVLGNGAAGAGDGTFKFPTGSLVVLTNSNPCADMAAGDFNGDGNVDLACLANDGRHIYIYLGNGGGSFGAPTSLTVPGNGLVNLGGDRFSSALVAADLNGDGIIDLASPTDNPTSGFSAGAVEVFLGNGDGTFQTPVASLISPAAPGGNGAQPLGVVALQNSQGGLDLLAVANTTNNTNGGRYDMYYLAGNGNGTFVPAAPGTNAPGFKQPFGGGFQLLRGDYNNDGLQDVAYRDENGVIYVALNSGSGTLTFVSTSALLRDTKGFMATGDFNGDGILDLVGDFTASANFQTVLGVGDGTFGKPRLAATCNDTVYPATGDYNGDRRDDIAGACANSLTVDVARSLTNTTLTVSPQSQSAFGQEVTLTAAISGNAPTGSVTFYNGVNLLGAATVTGGGAQFATPLLPSSATPSGPLSLSAHYGGDVLNGDSASTVVTQTVTSHPGKGFQSPASVPSLTSPSFTAVGDFNNDGRPDLAISNAGSVVIELGNPDGTFSAPSGFPLTVPSAAYIAVGDFNGDGNLDLALLFLNNSGIGIYLGDGKGNFAASPVPLLSVFGTATTGIATGDFNNDGIADILFTANNAGNAQALMYLGNGNGTFTSSRGTNIVAGTPGQIALADFTHDGITDAVVPATNGSTFVYSLYVLSGQGDGTFVPTNLSTAGSAFSVVTADFNGDGFTDIAYSDSSGNIRIGINLGNGSFSFSNPIPSGSASGVYLAFGDFNGDGKLDLAASEPGNGNVVIFLGNGAGGLSVGSTVNVGASPGNLVTADFNGDDRTDFAVTMPSGNAVQVRLESGPTILSITPASTVAGAANFTFTINGANFAANDTVIWQPGTPGSTATTFNTIFNSASSLTVASSPALTQLVSTAGTAQITVVDATVAGLVSNAVTYTIGNPPAITAISPATAAMGGTALTLTVTGQNFVTGDTLTWTPVGGTATTGIPTTLSLNSTPQNGTLTATLTTNQATSLLASQGQVTITVVDPSGVPAAAATPNFAVVAPPAMTGLSPSSIGAGSPATSITITGSGFVNGDCVTWTQKTPQVASPVQLAGSSPCTATVTGSGIQQQIQVNIPANLLITAGTSTITVIDPDGAPASTPQTFTVAPPSITGLADSNGNPLTSVGTASSDFALTINGANFITGNNPSIVVLVDPTGASHALTPSAVTSTKITVTVPGPDVGVVAGTLTQVTVLNPAPAGVIGPCSAPGGITGACSNQFALSVGAPTISKVTPPAATTGGGSDTITVTGSNFVANSQLAWCNNCNGTPQALLIPTSISPSQLVISIPPNLLNNPGTVQISVTNTPASLNNSNTNSAPVSFPISTLGIASISPTFVLAGGPAFTLIINGQNSNFDGGATVLFTGLPSIVPSQQSGATITPNQIIITVPASYISSSAAGSLNISVQDSNGSTTPSVSLPIQVFTLTSVTPSALIAGSPDTALVITGTGFGSASQMTVQWTEGTASTNLTILSATSNQINAVVTGGPQGLLAQPGTAQLSATETVPGGSISTIAAQTITVSPPSISSLTPSSSLVNGTAFLMTVNGSNFLTGSVVQWTDSTGKTTALTTTFVSTGKLSAFVPSTLITTAGTALISVLNGTVPSNGVVFSVGPTPTINTDGTGLGICPGGVNCQSANSVAAGSASIVLQVNGLNYQSGAVVDWTVNGVTTALPTAFIFASGNNPNASLNASVSAALLSAPATAVITVVNPGNSVSNAVFFTVGAGPTPTLSQVTAVGPVILGSPIQLAVTGTNFVNGALVQWNNGTAVTGLATIFVDSGDLNAVVPSNLVTAPSTVGITVQSAGVTTASKPFTIPAITITSLGTTTAVAGSGSLTLTVNGGNFTSASIVQWSGGSGPQNLVTTVVSPTQLSAVVPASLVTTAGTAFVDVATGTLTSNALPFVVSAAPSTAPTIFTDGTGLAVCPGGTNCKVGDTALAGSSSFVLQVSGTNYVSGSVVVWTANGTATNLVTAIVFPSGGNPNATLNATVPSSLLAAPATALITVLNPGNVGSNGVLFLVNAGAAPTLTAVTAVGPVVLGSAVELAVTGSNFVNGAVVQWNNGTITALPTVFNDSGDLSALVPSNLVTVPGTVAISVLSGGATTASRPFTIPTITLTSLGATSITAGSGPIQLIVNGGTFTSNSTVQWTGGGAPQALATTMVSSSQLSALVPASLLTSPGTAFVSVLTGTLTSNSLQFSITPAPSTAPTIFTDGTGLAICPGGTNCVTGSAITAGSPSFVLQVSGTNYLSNSVVVWTANGVATNLVTAFSFATGGNPNPTLNATIPASLLAAPTTALITVQNPGNVVSNGVLFSVTAGAPPTLTSVTAAAAVVLGNPIQLQIVGSNFVNGATVQWTNGATTTALATAFVDASDLSATVPSTLVTAPATVSITVSSGGVTTASKPFIIPTIAITSLSTNSVTAGSSAVQLLVNGGNFTANSMVQWTGSGAPQVLTTTLLSVSQLSALVPASLLATPGTAFVNVVTGTLSSNSLPFTVTSPAGPTITTLSSSSIQVGSPGTQITVSGTNFVNGSVVQWNAGGTPVALTTGFIGSTQLSALVPATLLASAGSVFISVQNPNGGGVSNLVSFTVTPVAGPSITSLSVTTAVIGSPGFALTVTGANFVNGAVATWNSGGTPTPLNTGFVSSTQLTVVVPSTLLTAAATALITVQNPDKTTSNGVTFTVTSGLTPTLTTVTAVGTVLIGSPIQLAITGSNFISGAVVQWSNGATTTALVTTFVDANDLNAVVPATLVTAPGTVSITVFSAGATSAAKPFTIPTIAITSLGTTSATAGSGPLQLIVNGGNFTANSVVEWAGSGAPQALATTVISTTQLSAVVPTTLLTSAGTVFVSVVTGTLNSNSLPFTIMAPAGPTITTLSSTSIQVGSAGTQITVSGTNFVNGSVVQWNAGGTPVALTTGFIGSTQLSALVPATLLASAGTVFISVLNPSGGGVSNLVSFTVTPVAGPSITSLSVTSAVVGASGFALTVTGSNFVNGAVATWNTGGTPTPLNTGFVSATQLTLLVPSTLLASAATALITVQNPDKTTSNGVTFSVVSGQTPTLTAVTAVGTVLIGSPIQLAITGTNFANGAVVLWTNGATTTALATTFIDANDLSAVAPATLVTAPTTVSISVLSAGVNSAAKPFTIPTIAISSLGTTSATAGTGPLQLTVNGANFTANSVVQWAGSGAPQPLATTVISATQLNAVVPTTLLTSAGTVFVSVLTGTLTSNALPFTIMAPAGPTISTLSSTSVQVGSPGIQFTVSGTNFVNGSLVQWNTGGTPVALTTGFIGSTQLSALVPATLLASAGTVFISVLNPNGGGVSNLVSFTVTPVAGPSITSLSDTSMVIGSPGFALTVTGANFVNGAVASWNTGGTPTPLNTGFVSSTQLTVVVPSSLLAAAATALITVQNPDKTTSNGVTFSVVSGQTPTLTAVTAVGTVLIGSPIQLAITGTNFISGAVVLWTNGATTTALVTTFIDASDLSAVAPATLVTAPTTVSVSVLSAGVNSAAKPFTIPTIAISSLGTTSATAGTGPLQLTVNGGNFTASSLVQWTASGAPQPLATTVISATQLNAVVPTSLLLSAGTVFVNVLTGTLNSNSLPFTVTVPAGPTITTLSSNSIQVGSPGTQITVSGTNFVNGSVVQWNGGGSPIALTTGFIGSTQLSALVPSTLLASAGTVFISVQNPNGGGISNLVSFTVTPVSGPSITSLSATSTVIGSPGFALTVTGANFANGAVATWNAGGTPTPLNTGFVSSTQLTVVVPSTLLTAAATALITVQNPDKTTSNGVTFTVASGLTPTLTAVSAVGTVLIGSPIQLAITGSNFISGAVVQWTSGATTTALATTFIDSNDLSAVVPATLVTGPGTVSISVLSGGANSAAKPFTIPTIAISSLGTTSAIAGAGPLQLIVNGGNFTANSIVQWAGSGAPQALATTVISPTQLSAVVPTTLLTSAGTVFVSVLTGTLSSNSLPFTIMAPAGPTLTTLSSTSVQVGSAGIQFTVTGTNFVNGSVVQWNAGGTPVALTTGFIGSTQLSALVPATLLTTAGTVFISVLNPNGGGVSNLLSFTVAPVSGPSITSLSVTSAVIGASGFALSVTGTNFVNGAVAMWNTGGAPTPLNTGFVSSTQLTVLVPSTLLTSAATALITVQNPDKTTSNGVTFSVVSGLTPTLTSVTAVGSVLIGSSVQLAITGTNFANGAVVQWTNGTATTALATTFVDSSDLSAVVPANLVTAPATVSISVLSSGVTSAPKPFTIPTITITSLGPNTVVVGGPTFPLTVNGQNFTSNSVVQWTSASGPQSLATTLVSSTQLSVLVPGTLIASPATVFINVLTGTLTSNSLPLTISIANAPTITSLGTNSVQAGSVAIEITVLGTNFVSGSVVQWNSGGTPQSLATAFGSSTILTALVPATLIATPSTVFISVSNPNNGGVSNLVAFTIASVSPPQILTSGGLVPSGASTGSAGITLTITGTNFVNGAAAQWNTSGTPTALTTGFVSSNQLTALVPSSLLLLPTTALITVQNPDKSMSNAIPFVVSGPAPVTTPTLSSISPTSASAGAPTLQLSVTGLSFVSATGTVSGSVVQWNGSPVPTSFVSATQLTATVDTSLLQSPGSNFVSVMNGNISSGGVKFQVNGPTLSALAPTSITAGNAAFNLVLTGTNFVAGSLAVWNNSNLPTTVNSATQLTAQVPANLVATAGSAFVLVTNPGGSSTGPQIFTISIPPASTLTGLNPATAIAGGPAFQLTVTGTGFVNGSVVLWNGSPLGTGFLSATQVFALISSNLIATAGTANVTVQNPGAPVSAALSFSINGPSITTLTPATANAGDPAFTLTVAGTNFVPGSAVQWNGVVLPTSFGSATQLLASVPATNVASPGTASITVQNPGGAVSAFQLFTVGQPALRITTGVLPDGVVGTSYSQVLAAQGGNQPYTWTLTAGSLPGGMNLDPSSGTLSGVPTGASTGTLGITVTDAVGRVATKSLQLNIVLALTVTTASPLPMATAGTAYSTVLAATGGTPSYLWSITGSVPPGLSLNVATGQISGVPTAPGSYTFTISVSDSRQQQNATKVFNLAVTVATFTISGLNATSGPAQQVPLSVTIGTPYTTVLTGSLTITFTSAVGGDDPSIQFSTGGRTVNFTIPAGSTSAVFGQNQQLLLGTGTVAGTITITATLLAQGSNITPTGLAPVTTTVAKQVPVITAVTLKQGSGGVVVGISGYSTTKEVTQATLQFNAAANSSLTSGTVTVPLSATLAAWYSSVAASGFGSQFTVSVPISIQGDVSAIGSVTVTLTNTQGNSAPVTAQLQ